MEGFPTASGRGGGRLPRSIWIGHPPILIVKPGYPMKASTHFPGRLSEMIWKVGIFKCEVGRSHTPDLAAPFLFLQGHLKARELCCPQCGFPGCPGLRLLLQRLLKILIKSRPSCALCFISIRRRKTSFMGGCSTPPLTWEVAGPASVPIAEASQLSQWAGSCALAPCTPCPSRLSLPEPRPGKRTAVSIWGGPQLAVVVLKQAESALPRWLLFFISPPGVTVQSTGGD